MPRKLEEWPGIASQLAYESQVDAYFRPYFNGDIWEFNDQEVNDLRVHLGLKKARTRDTIAQWFIKAARSSGVRQGKAITVKRLAGATIILQWKGVKVDNASRTDY